MATTYRNSFYRPDCKPAREEFFTVDVAPQEYRGHLIFHRQPQVWDIVKGGVCVGMYAGPNGARGRIDVMASVAPAT